MFTFLASTALFHSPEARLRPIIISSQRDIDAQSRVAMEATARGTPTQEHRDLLAENGWNLVEHNGLYIFIDMGATRYGLKFKQYKFHKSLVDYFDRFPNSQGYASEEFTSILKNTLLWRKGLPINALPKRISLGRRTSLIFAVSEKHRQESGSLTCFQDGITIPLLEEPNGRFLPASNVEALYKLVLATPDHLTELIPSKNDATKLALFNIASKKIDRLTRELEERDSKVKDELFSQACSSNINFKYFQKHFKHTRYASLPILLRASVEDQLRKTIRTYPKSQFFSNATFWPVRAELEIIVNVRTPNGPQTISLVEVLKDYPTQTMS